MSTVEVVPAADEDVKESDEAVTEGEGRCLLLESIYGNWLGNSLGSDLLVVVDL